MEKTAKTKKPKILKKGVTVKTDVKAGEDIGNTVVIRVPVTPADFDFNYVNFPARQ